MKRTAFAIIVILSAAVLAAPAAAARKNDFKVIQAAVKNGAMAEAREGREPRWFKVLIKDHGSDKASLKITLPVALIEVVLASSDSRRFKVDESCGEIDLKAVWAALKKAGPLALVEIEDDGAVIRVWLE
ncbi:MAG TPA: hypothetical protein P5119_06905 [Candidatus Aminicenantes bacterium]|nr:hypothetical protein [Candidatus Aminicenantes bacterium]HRY65057.1 hypothetical protein [Candidatus Aminicenantes bacterium]HRZ71970.1 hypothetical protein [Candidatus Aminicenantes bacterium]